MTTILPSANNVNWAKQPLKVQLNVILAMLDHLAKPKVFVQHARLGSFKIPKVKNTAVTLVPRRAKNPTTKAPGVNCHRGGLAKSALNICTTKKIKHNGNAANAPTAHIAMPTYLITPTSNRKMDFGPSPNK